MLLDCRLILLQYIHVPLSVRHTIAPRALPFHSAEYAEKGQQPWLLQVGKALK